MNDIKKLNLDIKEKSKKLLEEQERNNDLQSQIIRKQNHWIVSEKEPTVELLNSINQQIISSTDLNELKSKLKYSENQIVELNKNKSEWQNRNSELASEIENLRTRCKILEANSEGINLENIKKEDVLIKEIKDD